MQLISRCHPDTDLQMIFPSPLPLAAHQGAPGRQHSDRPSRLRPPHRPRLGRRLHQRRRLRERGNHPRPPAPSFLTLFNSTFDVGRSMFNVPTYRRPLKGRRFFRAFPSKIQNPQLVPAQPERRRIINRKSNSNSVAQIRQMD